MVNCTVFSCKRRSETSNLREHGISYHKFPKDTKLNQLWSKFCGQHSNWNATRTSVICSEHFTPESFQALENNRRKLVDGAIPTLKSSQCTVNELSKNTTEMEDFKYCRVCLITDVKMYNLDATTDNSVGVVYSQLAQIPKFPINQHVCFECASLLKKYKEFKSKCLRAHRILVKIKVQITKDDLQRHRKENNLESHLIFSPFELLEYGTIENNIPEFPCDSKVDANINQENTSKDEEIKEEIESIIEEHITIEETESIHDDGEIPDLVATSSDNENIFNYNDNSSIEDLPKRNLRLKRPRQTKVGNVKLTKTDDNRSKKQRQKRKVKKPTGDRLGFKSRKKEVDLSPFNGFATVVTLTPEEARQDIILRKYSNNYINSLFKCDICFKGFETETAFDNHMKKHSPEQGDLECEICHFRFARKLTLWRHKERHKRKFICDVCPYVCVGIHQAKCHVNLHKGKVYICDICGDVFRVHNSLSMHKQAKHLVSEFICEHCGYVFGTPRGLATHVAILHSTDTNAKLGPECEECGVHFATEAAWKRHLVQSTKHGVSNGCKICGEKFSNLDELKSHKKVHSRRPKYRMPLPAACTICNKWQTKRSEYEAHMMSEHPQSDEAKKLSELQKHVCEVCGQVFRIKVQLNYHRNKHTGERPYKCTECNKSFTHPNLLSIHKSSAHTGDDFKCDRCGRVCTSKKSLSSHMKIHLGIRPYKCDSCDKTFLHPCEVKTHVKHAHNNVPWPKKKKKVDEET